MTMVPVNDQEADWDQLLTQSGWMKVGRGWRRPLTGLERKLGHRLEDQKHRRPSAQITKHGDLLILSTQVKGFEQGRFYSKEQFSAIVLQIGMLQP